MSFTQEKMINIKPDQDMPYIPTGDYCDGCDAKCTLGYRRCNFGCHIYPTIDGKIIERYIDENYKSQFTGASTVTPQQAYQQLLCVQFLAGKIARLCDHYKTRQRNANMSDKTNPENRTFKINPKTKQQIRDAHILSDLVQVRLFEGTRKFGHDLGKPITMGQALKLMKRFHNISRPEKICLDTFDCRFFAEMIYAYPPRFSDDAAAELRLVTHFGKICPKCNINSDYKLHACVNKIMLGECCDEFIRKTVGKIVFPELYANKKQKQR